MATLPSSRGTSSRGRSLDAVALGAAPALGSPRHPTSASTRLLAALFPSIALPPSLRLLRVAFGRRERLLLGGVVAAHPHSRHAHSRHAHPGHSHPGHAHS